MGKAILDISCRLMVLSLDQMTTTSGHLVSAVINDIRWNTVGDGLVQGKEEFVEALERMKTIQVVELTINHVVTHGKAGAVNGTTKLKNGSTRAFCDVYEFSGAKGTAVKEIASYVIEIA